MESHARASPTRVPMSRWLRKEARPAGHGQSWQGTRSPHLSCSQQRRNCACRRKMRIFPLPYKLEDSASRGGSCFRLLSLFTCRIVRDCSRKQRREPKSSVGHGLLMGPTSPERVGGSPSFHMYHPEVHTPYYYMCKVYLRLPSSTRTQAHTKIKYS